MNVVEITDLDNINHEFVTTSIKENIQNIFTNK